MATLVGGRSFIYFSCQTTDPRREHAMPQPIINPYEPVLPSGHGLTNEPLCFRGDISRADYQRMLVRNTESWLYLILAVLHGVTILLFGPLSLGLAAADGHWVVFVALIAFWTVMLGALWFLKLRINPRDIARRMLSKYPDLLGPASGEFCDSGLLFHDGVQTFWFGPPYWQHVGILHTGVRMNVGGNAYRYLALCGFLFDDYQPEQAQRIKQRWMTLASQAPNDDGSPIYLDLWNRISHPPPDAIHFRGQLSIESQMRTPELRNKLIGELLFFLSLPPLAMLFRDHFDSWAFWAGQLFAAYGLINNARMWWAYSRSTLKQSWYQIGWVAAQELAFCNYASGVRMPLSQIVSKVEQPELLSLTLKNGANFHLQRHMVGSDADWERLCALPIGSRADTALPPVGLETSPQVTSQATPSPFAPQK